MGDSEPEGGEQRNGPSLGSSRGRPGRGADTPLPLLPVPGRSTAVRAFRVWAFAFVDRRAGLCGVPASGPRVVTAVA